MLAELARTISEATASFEQQQLLVSAILKETADIIPAEASIEDVIAERHEAEALAAAATHAEVRKRRLAEERAATAKAILDAEVEKERKLREIKLAAIEANTQVEAQKIRDAIAQVEREEAKRQADLKVRVEREIADANFERALPEIRKYLVPFITPGNKHIESGQWKYTEEQRPLSLGGIQAKGALENTAAGRQAFYALAGGQSNDRPNGVFRDFIGGHIHNPRDVVRAQNLLQEFGDLLVEKGLLEP